MYIYRRLIFLLITLFTVAKTQAQPSDDKADTDNTHPKREFRGACG